MKTGGAFELFAMGLALAGAMPALARPSGPGTARPVGARPATNRSAGARPAPGGSAAGHPTAILAGPDLTLDKQHTSPFVVGQTATYDLVVRNIGTDPTSVPTTVVDALPAGLSYVPGPAAG